MPPTALRYSELNPSPIVNKIETIKKHKVMRGTEDNRPTAPKSARVVFGIIMVLVYLGVGLLFILNVFSIDNQTVSVIIGALLFVYGIWRGYRLYKGVN